jgi:hypothetical protein
VNSQTVNQDSITTTSSGSWKDTGLVLLPHLLLLLLAAAEFFRWDILTELVWLLLWPAVCLSGVALIGLALWLLTWAIEINDSDLPLWSGSWFGFAFLLGSLPVLFVFYFLGSTLAGGLHTLLLLVILLLLFEHNKRLALLAVLPVAAFSLFLATSIVNDSWFLFLGSWSGLALATVAVMRWFQRVDRVMWLLFGLGLATTLYLVNTTGNIIERDYIYFQYLVLVVTAYLLWWLWHRVQERPSYTGWIGYGLLLTGLAVKTATLGGLLEPFGVFPFAVLEQPDLPLPPFPWQEWLVSLPVLLAWGCDLLSLLLLGLVLKSDGRFAPKLYDLLRILLIISAPLIYNMEPLNALSKQQTTIPLLDVTFSPLVAFGWEGLWLLLALILSRQWDEYVQPIQRRS